MTQIARRRAGAVLALILLWLATACGGPATPPAETASPSPTPEAPETAVAQPPAPAVETPVKELLPLPQRPLPLPSPSNEYADVLTGVVLPYQQDGDAGPVRDAEQRLVEMMPANYTGVTLDGRIAVDYARQVALEIPQAAGTIGAVPAVAECLSEHTIPAAKAFVDAEYHGAAFVLMAEGHPERTLPGTLPHCLNVQVFPGGMDGVCLERYQYDYEPDGQPVRQWAMIVGTGPEYCLWAKRFHSGLSPVDMYS